jgi:hypothetical protein
MTAPATDDEFTEITDANIPRVDLVGKAANGMQFLIAKSEDGQAGMFDPEFVRDMVAKADPEPAATDTVTVTGSPGAIARMIHDAAVRKADASTTDASQEGPVTTTSAEATVEKADGVDLETADIIADAAPSGTAETMPGSPDWENLDGDTAWQAIGVLGRAKAALEWLIDRENQESVTGDPDAGMAAYDLGEACCAIDYAIGTLGAFAAGEKLAADMGDELEAVGKAVAGLSADLAPIATLEGYGPVVKAGRVLSSANESAIRGAVESLQKVLASLPAPVDDSGQPVAKEQETPMAKLAATAADPDALAKGLASVAEAGADGAAALDVVKDAAEAAAVVKADDLSAVSTADLKRQVLTGSTSERNAALQELGLRTLTGDDGAAAATADEPAADAAPAADAPADLEPAPAAEAGTAADAAATAPADDDVNKAAETTETTDPDLVLKAAIGETVKAAIDEHSAGQASLVKSLEDRISALEESPAPPKILSNGALPPEHMLRGHTNGAPSAAVTKAAEMRDRFTKSQDPAERDAIANEMNEAATVALAELHRRR